MAEYLLKALEILLFVDPPVETVERPDTNLLLKRLHNSGRVTACIGNKNQAISSGFLFIDFML